MKQALKDRAAAHGQSMDAEARAIIEGELESPSSPPNGGRSASDVIREAMRRTGGVELDIPERSRR